MDKIFTFKPYLKTVVWGGDKIKSFKNIDTQLANIGESWEISGVPGYETVVDGGIDSGMNVTELIDKYKEELLGERVYRKFGNRFPLLVKIIDARDKLSVQVHPDDDLAARRHGCCGKSEMWYIIDAEDDAYIISGLAMETSPGDYRVRVDSNTISDILAHHKSHPGDVFFLPAGRIHAIGGGNLLVEIQQASDITYRIYDYGRPGLDGKPRPLHVEEAADAIDYNVHESYITDYDRYATGDVQLVKCPHFDVRKIGVGGQATLPCGNGSFTVIMCISGSCTIDADNEASVNISRGNTILVAASARSLTITGTATLISATIPD